MPSCPFCAEEIPRNSAVCPYCNSDLANVRSSPKPQSKQASSATIWIIVLSISAVMLLGCAGVMAALLLPAVQQAREAARRSQSKNHLKQIGLAMHNYHDVHQVFPPGGTVDETGVGHHGWMTMLLPYMDEYTLFEEIHFEEPWDSPSNRFNFSQEIPSYLLPGVTEVTDSSGFALAHYAGNSLVMGPNSSLRIRNVTDGTSNTMLAGEANGNYRPWGHPENYRDPNLGINNSPDGFGSPYRGGAHILLMDGSVRFMSENVDSSVLKAISTPDGGEPVPLY